MHLTAPVLRLCATTFIAAAFVNGARGAPSGDGGSTGGCALSQSTPAATPTQSCLACHAGAESGHPVDLQYGQAAASRGALVFRSAEEAVRRGVMLPDGKITCLTCHDARSPWKNHIALPPGAKPEPAVNPRDSSSYEEGPMRDARIKALQMRQLGGERQAVTAKPLCLGCHALD